MPKNQMIELNKEIQAIQKAAREFARKEVLPRTADDEKNHTFQRDLVTKMADLDFLGCPIPEEYGGNDMGFLVERSHNDIAILSVRSEREILINKKCYKELSVRLR
jgi:alkylation response protein AidB-like acyl-CoA dehydrogenase